MATRLMTAIVLAVLTGIAGTVAQAVDVKLTDYLAYIDVYHAGEQLRIQRIQDQEHVLNGGFAKTPRKCPPFCIQPMNVAPGVTTNGEVEIFRFIDRQHAAGTGMLIDARTPSWFAKGTIPSSVNIPLTQFAGNDEDPERLPHWK